MTLTIKPLLIHHMDESKLFTNSTPYQMRGELSLGVFQLTINS
jgi:hypothetical protein